MKLWEAVEQAAVTHAYSECGPPPDSNLWRDVTCIKCLNKAKKEMPLRADGGVMEARRKMGLE